MRTRLAGRIIGPGGDATGNRGNANYFRVLSRDNRITPMSCFNSSVDCREEKLECFGPFALRLLAIAAGVAIFAPLLVAFAAPFLG